MFGKRDRKFWPDLNPPKKVQPHTRQERIPHRTTLSAEILSDIDDETRLIVATDHHANPTTEMQQQATLYHTCHQQLDEQELW